MRAPVLASLLFALALPLAADEPMCGNGPENDAMLRRMAERGAQRSRIAGNAAATTSVLRDGTFYLAADELTIPGIHRIDLAGQSLVFEPRASAKYAARRIPLQYVEPTSTPIVFAESQDWFVRYDIRSFALPLFGGSVTTLYVSAYNGIYLTPPAAESEAPQVDALEAAVQPQAVLSPLLLTKTKPKNLIQPDVTIEETSDAVVITWRSTKGKYFGFDVQAALGRDGSVVYSYRNLRGIEWGTPILTPGYDGLSMAERVLATVNDPNDATKTGTGAMTDIARFDVIRVAESDLILFRIKVAAAIDPAALPQGQTLRYWVAAGTQATEIDVDRTGATSVYAPGRPRFERNGVTARYRGDTVELFVAQDSLLLAGGSINVSAFSMVGPSGATDLANLQLRFDAPPQRIATDLSQAGGAELRLPIAEPFLLGALDVDAVWSAIKANHGLTDADVDGLAIYQAFYSDIIFFAGAYSTVGNPQVDGIGARVRYGSAVPKAPALLHMNQFTYGYNSAEKSSSQVILHEFGHRWLYHTSIRVNGSNSRVLNPLTAHPAQYVHLPTAFRIYDEIESSTMGGAVFSQQGDGSWIARVANAGYSWLELYLMGLASSAEVQPWFYLGNTQPALGGEYWPVDKQVVTGTKTDVSIEQIVGASGERLPSTAASQRAFRVPFVIVTYPDELATPEQIAQMNALRLLFEKNFATATGGRASVTTHWGAGKRRRVS